MITILVMPSDTIMSEFPNKCGRCPKGVHGHLQGWSRLPARLPACFTDEVPFLRYVSHPEVLIDPAVPVPRWGLTDVGRRRAAALCRQPWMPSVRRLVSSDETKALEAAAIVAVHRGLPIEVRAGTGETDRSATGFLSPDDYELVSTAWFEEPDVGPRGWESAIVVQQRIVAALSDVLAGDEDVVVVGHGGAGTLLYCALGDIEIAQIHDQRSAGHYFTVDLATRRPTHAWTPIDALSS